MLQLSLLINATNIAFDEENFNFKDVQSLLLSLDLF